MSKNEEDYEIYVAELLRIGVDQGILKSFIDKGGSYIYFMTPPTFIGLGVSNSSGEKLNDMLKCRA
jgi:hypothetical protein